MLRYIKVSFSLCIIISLAMFFCPKSRAESQDAEIAVADTQTKDAINNELDKLEAQNIDGEEETLKAFPKKLSKTITEKEKICSSDVESYVRYMPTQSLANQPGKISLIKSETEYNFEFRAFEKIPIELSLNGEYINIETNDAVPVSLPSHLTGLIFGMRATLPLFNVPKTYIRLGISPAFYSHNWNFASSSLNIGSQTLFIYQPNEKWTFVGGIAVFPGFEDVFVPVGGLIYKPNDKLVFDLIPTRPTISYRFSDMLTLFAEAGLSGGEFKVPKDGLKGTALTYNETHLGLGVKFTLNKYISASLSTGRMFNQYLQYRDSLGKVNVKNGMYSEFRVEAGI